MTFAETFDHAVATSPHTAAELAEKAGVPASTVSSWRVGTRLPGSMSKLVAFIEAVGWSRAQASVLRRRYMREVAAQALMRAGGSDGY